MSVNSTQRSLLANYLLGQGSSAVQGKNYIKNSFGMNGTTNVSVSGTATVAKNTTTPLTGISDFAITLPNNTTDYVEFALDTLDNSLKNQNCQLTFDYKITSLGSAVQAQVLINSVVNGSQVLSATPTQSSLSLNVPCGDLTNSTTVRISNVTGNSGASSLNIANVNYGRATNIGNYYKPTVFNARISSGASVSDQTPSNFISSCSGSGSYTCTFVTGFFASTPICVISLDGATVTSTAQITSTSTTTFTYRTFDSVGTNGARGVTVTCQKTGTDVASAQQVIAANQQKAPTIQTFTTVGSSTYTPSTGATFIKVKMVGGGGSGGAGSNTGTAGSAGGNTTFGTFLTATGGSGGPAGSGTNQSGGAGGTATVASPAISIVAVSGGVGSGQTSPPAGGYSPGGAGAASPFGGAGGSNSAAGKANTGSGGAGLGIPQATGYSGTGGGAGGYIEALISNPALSYSYTVGAGGATGGGAGGSGVIIVEEYYSQTAPILIGSVTSNSSGAERIERVTGSTSASGSFTVASQSGSFVSSSTCSGSVCTITMTTPFASTPTCVANLNTNSITGRSCYASGLTASTFSVAVINTTSGAALQDTCNVICMGAR
jgi:hypothetical protein